MVERRALASQRRLLMRGRRARRTPWAAPLAESFIDGGQGVLPETVDRDDLFEATHLEDLTLRTTPSGEHTANGRSASKGSSDERGAKSALLM